jgi:hypothetical protein
MCVRLQKGTYVLCQKTFKKCLHLMTILYCITLLVK